MGWESPCFYLPPLQPPPLPACNSHLPALPLRRPPPSPSPMPTLTASGLNILLMEMRCTLPSRVTTSMWMMNTLTGEALTCVKGGREKRTGGRLRGE